MSVEFRPDKILAKQPIRRRIAPLLLSSLLLLTACEPADTDPIATECQGKITYKELRERSIAAGILWGQGRNLRVELIRFNDVSCDSPIGKINPEHGVYPCDQQITWGEVIRVVEAQQPPYKGPKMGRGYLQRFRESLPVCNRIQ